MQEVEVFDSDKRSAMVVLMLISKYLLSRGEVSFPYFLWYSEQRLPLSFQEINPCLSLKSDSVSLIAIKPEVSEFAHSLESTGDYDHHLPRWAKLYLRYNQVNN